MALYLDPHLYDAIWVQAEAYKVDFYLIAAHLRQESGFNPLAIGDNIRSFGLGQLNLDGAGGGHDPSQLLVIDDNLEIAVAYMHRCQGIYPEDLPRAIAAYNRGITGAAPPFDPDNDSYVKSILYFRDKYRATGVFRRRVWYVED